MADPIDTIGQNKPSKPRLISRLRRALRGIIDAGDRVDVAQVIRDREDSGENFQPEQRDMFLKVADFDRLRVRDVMIPRADIVGVEVDTPLGALASLFADAAVSRMPIYRETLDDPIGLVHIKDVVAQLAAPDGPGKPRPGDRVLQKIRRDLLIVPPSMRLTALLLKMQSTRQHMAIVVDEYGGTDGLVSIEDLVEQIVGDIEDEHDLDEAELIVKRGNGQFEADARAPIADLEEMAGLDLSLAEDGDEIDTLGGLVFTLLGRVPQRGEVVRHPIGLDFEVLEADPRRIRRLRISPTPAKSSPREGDGSNASAAGSVHAVKPEARGNGAAAPQRRVEQDG